MDLYFHVKYHKSQFVVSGNHTVNYGSKNSHIYFSWHWNGHEFTFRNDEYGFYPVYIFFDDNQLIVSTTLLKILEAAGIATFDEEAFAVFLRTGYLIGEDTLFQSIRTIPAGTELTWQNGEINFSSNRPFPPRAIRISRLEAVETYAALFQKAVEKTLPENRNFAVPLSGGRDSRHILFALDRAKHLPDAALTIIHPPPRSNQDARIAKILCDAIGINHITIEQPASRFKTECRKNQLTDYSVFEHGWFLTMGDFAKNKWRTIYDGIAGDVLSAGLFLTGERLKLVTEGKFEELADEIIGPEGYLPSLFDKKLLQKFSRRKAVERVAHEIAGHQNAPNPIGSFFFWNRTRRAVALSPFRLFDETTDILTPYLDPQVFRFLSSLPAEMLLDQNFHTETIAFAYPEYSEISYEQKNVAPVYNDVEFNSFNRDIFRYSLTRRSIKFVNRRFFLLRFLRSMIDKNYGRAIAGYGEQAIVLMQLERLVKN